MAEKTPFFIIGAGICGLSLGDLLHQKKKEFYLIEKSKSVGGRLATRRSGAAVFDHGAQFYKHSPDRILFWHEKMQNLGVSQLWFQDERGVQYFSAKQGMTQIAKVLSESCRPIIFNERVIKIEHLNDELKVICESGSYHLTGKVILTCPLPQSLEILRSSQISYPAELDTIQYAKALVGLFDGVSSSESSAKNVSFRRPGNQIFSISNNQSKKISLSLCYTVVMKSDFSEQNFNDTDENILRKIESEFLNEMTNESFEITSRQMKKWRYSHPLTTYPENYLKVGSRGEIILAGDAFGRGSHGSISGAVRSAQDVAGIL